MLLLIRYVDSKFPAVQSAKVASKYQIKYKIYISLTILKLFYFHTSESDTVNPFQNTGSLIVLSTMTKKTSFRNTLKDQPKTLLTFEVFCQSAVEP